jgi:hypothetical protein
MNLTLIERAPSIRPADLVANDLAISTITLGSPPHFDISSPSSAASLPVIEGNTYFLDNC